MPAFHMLQERFSGPSPQAPSLADAMTPGSDMRSPLPSSRHLQGSSSFVEQQQVGLDGARASSVCLNLNSLIEQSCVCRLG